MKIDKIDYFDCGDYFTVVNLNGNKENHTHVKKQGTAEMLKRFIMKKIIPKSPYLRESCKRVTLDERYIESINIKINKDKDKQHYINVNKGCKR